MVRTTAGETDRGTARSRARNRGRGLDVSQYPVEHRKAVDRDPRQRQSSRLDRGIWLCHFVVPDPSRIGLAFDPRDPAARHAPPRGNHPCLFVPDFWNGVCGDPHGCHDSANATGLSSAPAGDRDFASVFPCCRAHGSPWCSLPSPTEALRDEAARSSPSRRTSQRSATRLRHVGSWMTRGDSLRETCVWKMRRGSMRIDVGLSWTCLVCFPALD